MHIEGVKCSSFLFCIIIMTAKLKNAALYPNLKKFTNAISCLFWGVTTGNKNEQK